MGFRHGDRIVGAARLRARRLRAAGGRALLCVGGPGPGRHGGARGGSPRERDPARGPGRRREVGRVVGGVSPRAGGRLRQGGRAPDPRAPGRGRPRGLAGPARGGRGRRRGARRARSAREPRAQGGQSRAPGRGPHGPRRGRACGEQARRHPARGRWRFEKEVGDLPRAFTALTAALREDPADDETARMAERLAMETDGWACAELVADLSEVVAEITDKKLAAIAWTRLGRWYHERLRHDDYAVASFREAIKLDPARIDARERLEELYRKAQRRRLPRRGAGAARRDRAGDREEGRRAHVARRFLDETQLASTQKAVDAYERARAVDPANADALASLERLYRRSERWGCSRRSWRSARISSTSAIPVAPPATARNWPRCARRSSATWRGRSPTRPPSRPTNAISRRCARSRSSTTRSGPFRLDPAARARAARRARARGRAGVHVAPSRPRSRIPRRRPRARCALLRERPGHRAQRHRRLPDARAPAPRSWRLGRGGARARASDRGHAGLGAAARPVDLARSPARAGAGGSAPRH